MNNQQLIEKIHFSMENQCLKRGYATPVDVLMDLDILSKTDYEKWRAGNIPYLEKVCMINLNKLTELLKVMQQYSQKEKLKPSFCVYKQWGCKSIKKLRFSKSGSGVIEKNYATHFVNLTQLEHIKKAKEPSKK